MWEPEHQLAAQLQHQQHVQQRGGGNGPSPIPEFDYYQLGRIHVTA